MDSILSIGNSSSFSHYEVKDLTRAEVNNSTLETSSISTNILELGKKLSLIPTIGLAMILSTGSESVRETSIQGNEEQSGYFDVDNPFETVNMLDALEDSMPAISEVMENDVEDFVQTLASVYQSLVERQEESSPEFEEFIAKNKSKMYLSG